MLSSIHFLLTYKCPYECDHCFLFCGPEARGTFTLAALREAFRQIDAVPTITGVYFEGGEPFLYYPLLVEGVRLARERGLSVGIVSNAFWALGVEDAKLWLGELAALGIDDLSLSDDAFHYTGPPPSPAELAREAALSLGMSAASIRIDAPTIESQDEKGAPVIGGGVMLRGRAAEKLAAGLPLRPGCELRECPHEDLRSPGRVHLDPYGNLQLCQGLLMGNLFEKPLGEIIAEFDPESDRVLGPILRGGPAELARSWGVAEREDGYVSPCHMCYLVRRNLVGCAPKTLGPKQVYGL